MKIRVRSTVLALALAAVGALASAAAHAQIFALDPMSSSLPGIGATSADILVPTLPAPGPGPGLPLPSIGLTMAELGLIPGDVIDAITLGDDAPLGPPTTIYFNVTRGSVGAAGPFTADVFSEVGAVPPGIQPEASGDIFSTNDPTCAVFPGSNTQVLDGDGIPLFGPPLTCYTGNGSGLAELLPVAPPPFNDQMNDFDWSLPGRASFFCVYFSLAPGSSSLIPGANLLRAAGGEPGDIFGTCLGPPPFHFNAMPALFNGLVSGGPGCAPPVCDDIDGLALFASPLVSLAPGSPTLGLSLATPGDLLNLFTGPPLTIGFPFFALGLTPADDVKGIELLVNPCAVPPFGDPPDADGVGGCDNCPFTFNPGQEDSDGNLIGDACDLCTDTDLDGFGNPGFPNFCPTDLCPFIPSLNGDADFDGRGDECDNCPLIPNPSQADADFDSIGDACDTCTDIDFDGYGLITDTGCLGVDNCVNVFNPAQTDTDLDGVGDACDNCVAVINPSQTDSDGDTFGNACDNCPAISNFGQTDFDLDTIGDACDICTLGVTMTKPQLKINKLLSGPGLMQLQMQAKLNFPLLTLPLPPLDVINPAKGMRVQIVDIGAGSTVLFDYTVPGGPVPTVCGVKDGWKTNTGLTVQKYGNKTNQNQNFACAVGSALGIVGAQAQDKTAKLKGASFKVKGKNGTYGPVTGPFQMTVVLGGAAESAGGQCGQHIFPAPNCVLGGGGKVMKCK